MMKTVNQLIFGRKMDYRPEFENNLYIDTVIDEIKKPENSYIQGIYQSLQKKRIRNVGERGSAELLASLAIFLSQVPDKKLAEIEKIRKMRNEW